MFAGEHVCPAGQMGQEERQPREESDLCCHLLMRAVRDRAAKQRLRPSPFALTRADALGEGFSRRRCLQGSNRNRFLLQPQGTYPISLHPVGLGPADSSLVQLL